MFKTEINRRLFLKTAVTGTVISALGGAKYVIANELDPRSKQPRADGRPRLPSGQRLVDELKPMGGSQGDPAPNNFTLHVSGEVERPFKLTFAELLALPATELVCDLHCVTGWTLFDSQWTGVQVAHLAEIAQVKSTVRHVIFEASNGYTANVPYAEATAPNVLLAYMYKNASLARPHGAPVRALIPDLYLWKSAKWLTGVSFVQYDRPGYWETRGYHNHGDPWKEERYSRGRK